MKKYILILLCFICSCCYCQYQARPLYSTAQGKVTITSTNTSPTYQYNNPYRQSTIMSSHQYYNPSYISKNRNNIVPFADKPAMITPGMRKITVYDSDGNPRETPGGDNDNPDWLYRYDETTGKWYCSTDGGQTWYEWREKQWGDGWLSYIFGSLFGGNGETWREYRGNEPGGPPGDPMDPFMEPIGNELVLLIFLFLWVFLKHYNLITFK